jgi:hypothetical protein
VKPRTDLAHVGGLAEVDVYVGDLVVLEKSEDVLSRAVGSRSGGSVGETPIQIVTGPTTGFLASPSSSSSSSTTFLKRTISIVVKRI